MNNIVKITNVMIEETDTPTQYEVYEDAPVQEQIKELFEITDSLKTEVKTLSDKVTKLEDGEIEPEPPSTEYPEYKQPTGSHNAYYNGDKVTFKGKKYICTAPEDYAVVWNPEEYPAYWKLVE